MSVEEVFDGFRKRFEETGDPVSVNFRTLVPDMKSKERFTHLIHSYPAKLLCNIPYYFLSATNMFCPYEGIVLDPFCGTGTVLLEAIVSGRNAYGADANPLAVLISKVKTTYIPKDDLLDSLSTILTRARRDRSVCPPDKMVEEWFSDSTINQLRRLEMSIGKVQKAKHKDFFLLCLSNLIKKVSFADPTISVPVKLNPNRFPDGSERRESALFRLKTLQNVDIYDKFESICLLNIARVDSLKDLNKRVSAEVISNDARNLTRHLLSNDLLPDSSVDLVFSSPPYAGAQKYIRSSRLNLYWLGTKQSSAIHDLNDKNIGREDYHRAQVLQRIRTGIPAADAVLEQLYAKGKFERACIVGTYLNEMKTALDESYRVLKPSGYMILVIGNNTVSDISFNTQDYLTTYLKSKGMHLEFKLIDDIKSYGLMTKRNKTANTISSEWILVLKKEPLACLCCQQ